MQNTVRSATRMDGVQAPIIPVVGDIIRQVPGTISLGQGVVHYGPPAQAIDAVRNALTDSTAHEYSGGTGRPDLVKRIAAKLAGENGIDIARGSAIMVTAGANMAFMHAVLAISEPGDEIILPVPFYFNHEMAIQMAGCRAVTVTTNARYHPDLDVLSRAITERTRAIVTVDYAGQPCNYDALYALARRHGLTLLAYACHALGASYRGRPVGSLGLMNAFSFHPVKHVSAGEGGAVTTQLRVNALAFSPDGTRLIAGTGSPVSVQWPDKMPKTGEVKVWRLDAADPPKPPAGTPAVWREKARPDWFTSPVTAVAFAPDGKTFAAGGPWGCGPPWAS